MTCANDDTVIDRILLINPESIIDASKTPKHYNKVLKYILCTPIIGTFIYNLLVSKDRIEENFMTDYFYDHCKFKKRDLAAYVEASQSEKSHGRYLYANICSNFTNVNVLNCLSKIDNSIFIIVGRQSMNIVLQQASIKINYLQLKFVRLIRQNICHSLKLHQMY